MLLEILIKYKKVMMDSIIWVTQKWMKQLILNS